MNNQKHKYLPFLMWVFPLVFFAYQFILRLWPGLMMHQIMEQFSISASKFGVMAAFYYYGYAGMQIPVAILLDKFGAKWIVFVFTMLCGLATILFTYSNNWYFACLGRFLVGAGSAVGFLAVSKVITEWFSATQYAKMISLSFTIGLMGAIYGGKPISLLIETYHWKNVALTLAFIAMLIGLGAYFVLGSHEKKSFIKTSRENFRVNDLKEILASPLIWLLSAANFLMVGALEGFSDVWGVPYLMSAYGITKNSAAELISFVFFGMLFGGPLLALLSKKLNVYVVIASCGVGMGILFTLLLCNQSYNSWMLALMFFSIGIMCCYQVIVFIAGAGLVKSHHLGVTIAFLNCINMLGGCFFHTSIGRLMDMFWMGEFSYDGVKIYSLMAYKNALTIIPVAAILGALINCLCWCLVVKNKKSLAV